MQIFVKFFSIEGVRLYFSEGKERLSRRIPLFCKGDIARRVQNSCGGLFTGAARRYAPASSAMTHRALIKHGCNTLPAENVQNTILDSGPDLASLNPSFSDNTYLPRPVGSVGVYIFLCK